MNRLLYDTCATKEATAMSIAPVSYVLDPIRYQHCHECRPELGIVGGTAVSRIQGNMVDLENNLFGIDRPGTRCTALKYQPTEPVQGKQDYKTNCYPRVDTTLKHLPTCRFMKFPVVPPTPAQPLFFCPSSSSH
jgi:hypothetical protein